MSKGSGKIEVAQYFMSSWWGFSIGPVDSISRIRVGEKKVMDETITESSVIYVDDQDLFGGVKKEGGVFGTITYLDGRDTQTIPEYLAKKLGLTSATCPAHRGIASLFFSGGAPEAPSGKYSNGRTWFLKGISEAGGLDAALPSIVPVEPETTEGASGGSSGSGGLLDGGGTGIYKPPVDETELKNESGFYWRANLPNIPPIEVTATRSPKVLSAATRMIGDDANPIHIIYETLTNTDWGIGAPTSSINTATFTAAAQVIFDEGIGTSFLWNTQQSGEEFISMVLEYVEGVIFVNPSNGLMEIKLIRGGYDVDTLFEITPKNAKLSGHQRKMWGETINEIVVTYTNPKNEKQQTVVVQDLGNIAMQGGVVSDNKDYSGVRSGRLAAKLGARDLRVASSPLMSCRAIVDRSAWNKTPGDVVLVTWPEHGMVKVPMRVGDVDYGKSTDSSVKLSLMEDIFGLDEGEYETPPETAWEPTSSSPSAMEYSLATTLPYFLMNKMGLRLQDYSDPDVAVAVMGAHGDRDINQYLIVYEDSTPNGETIWQGNETRSLLSRGLLRDALPFSPSTSTTVVKDVTPGYGVKKNHILLIGDDEEEQELCLITSVSGRTLSIKRGMMDTTPKAWPANTGVWFIPLDADVVDDQRRMGGMEVAYKLLTMTSVGVLLEADAPELIARPTRRPWLPLRPANCKVEGQFIGPVDVSGLSSVTLNWSNRNRRTEDSVLLQWNNGNVTPETGQTTTIQAIGPDGFSVRGEVNGLTGTSYELDLSIFNGATRGYVKFLSKNAAGDMSLQGHMIEVILS